MEHEQSNDVDRQTDATNNENVEWLFKLVWLQNMLDRFDEDGKTKSKQENAIN